MQLEVSLPRIPGNDGIINLKLKRKMQYKTYHKFETVRPHLIYESLLFLKDHHPEYKDVSILPHEEFLVSFEEKNPHCDEDNNEVHDNQSESEEDSLDEDEDDKSLEDKSDNVFNNVTCLCPEDPTSGVIVNTKSHSIKKKKSRKSNTIYEVAPGEGRSCNNWARDKKFEATGFPHIFCYGQGCFHSERDIYITLSQYFNQRILDHSGIFPADPDYVFSAEQLLEILQVESQIFLLL